MAFNIKDAKNDLLWRRIFNGEIGPSQLVKMGANELSIEMARWRERESQHNLELYKKEAAMNVTDKVRMIRFRWRTHHKHAIGFGVRASGSKFTAISPTFLQDTLKLLSEKPREGGKRKETTESDKESQKAPTPPEKQRSTRSTRSHGNAASPAIPASTRKTRKVCIEQLL